MFRLDKVKCGWLLTDTRTGRDEFFQFGPDHVNLAHSLGWRGDPERARTDQKAFDQAIAWLWSHDGRTFRRGEAARYFALPTLADAPGSSPGVGPRTAAFASGGL